MEITTNELLALATGILVIYNPPLAAMIYAPVTGHLPADIRRRISLRMFAWIAVVFVGVTWAGQFILNILGISAAALTMTGGLMLLVFAIPMALGQVANTFAPEQCIVDCDSWQRMIAAPLIFPLSIGGGMVALIVGTAAPMRSPADLLMISLVCIALAAIIGVTHFAAGSMARAMNSNHMEICKRIGGILLVAIAIQMLANGSRELLPGLAR